MPDSLDARSMLAGIVVPALKPISWVSVQGKTFHNSNGDLKTVVLIVNSGGTEVLVVTNELDRPHVVKCADLLHFGTVMTADLRNPQSIDTIAAWLVERAEAYRPKEPA